MKTLYVSDLDGTLLLGDQTLSEFTKNTINALCGEGMIFTYATARSFRTAEKVCKGLSGAGTAIVYNGAFTVRTSDASVLRARTFGPERGSETIREILRASVSPRVFSVIDGEERFTYTADHLKSLGAREYFRTRANDPRGRLGNESDLFEGDIFEISCVDKREVLEPLHEALKDKCQCHFYKDNYSPDWYLEILPDRATKANAVLELKELLGCEKVVCFGDSENDFSMFDIADECYAVANAATSLKARATAVIGSNEDDGVARFLLSHFENNR